jgi:DNA end-binding protein Ku
MPINTGILSFGLVAIPVKLYPAIKDQTVRFHLLHAKCSSRVQNRFWCPVCNEVVERDVLVRGFEHSKGKYIQLTEEELDALEAEANRSIDLKEFVPVAKVDPVYFESSYYLGSNEGGEKPYRLLAEALAKTQRAAVAEGEPWQGADRHHPPLPWWIGASRHVLPKRDKGLCSNPQRRFTAGDAGGAKPWRRAD